MTEEPEEDDGHAHCALCNAIPDRFLWLVEFAVGFRDHDTMVRTGPQDEECRGGPFLCYPGCVVAWLEGKLIEAEVELRNVDS